MRHLAQARNPYSRSGLWIPGSLALLAPRNDCFDGLTDASAFDERLLDHKMAGSAVIAFEKTARFKHLAQFFEHARAAAHHDAVVTDIQRRLTDIVKQLF